MIGFRRLLTVQRVAHKNGRSSSYPITTQRCPTHTNAAAKHSMKLTTLIQILQIHTGNNTFLFLHNSLGSLIRDSGANAKHANSSRISYLGGPSFARADPSYARADPEQNMIASHRLPPMKEVPSMPIYRQSNYKNRPCYYPNNHYQIPFEESEIRPGTLLGRSEVSCTLALLFLMNFHPFRQKF
jgi:hypothetical protein